MSRSERRLDPSKSLERLEKRHKQLDERVAQYETRRTLTTTEQVALQKLKKEKLATKDEILRMTQV